MVTGMKEPCSGIRQLASSPSRTPSRLGTPMQAIAQFIRKHLWWLVVLVATSLLVSHSFQFKAITVDTTTLILLGIILLSPFVAEIKKIKFGEFEAEIKPDEVNKVATEAETAIAEAPGRPESPIEPSAVGEEIRKLASTDVVIALAKLRIELESRLRKLHERARGGNPDSPSRFSAAQLTRDLTAGCVFPPEMGAAIRDVMAICNRVIHGEEIRHVDAHRIIDVGTSLLNEVDSIIRDFAVTHPVSKEVVSHDDVEHAMRIKYRVTTITPYVERPEQRVYEMTQEELDEFFSGYGEFAEFVIRVEPSGAGPVA